MENTCESNAGKVPAADDLQQYIIARVADGRRHPSARMDFRSVAPVAGNLSRTVSPSRPDKSTANTPHGRRSESIQPLRVSGAPPPSRRTGSPKTRGQRWGGPVTARFEWFVSGRSADTRSRGRLHPQYRPGGLHVVLKPSNSRKYNGSILYSKTLYILAPLPFMIYSEKYFNLCAVNMDQ